MIVIIVLWLLPFVLSPFSSKAALFSRMLQAALSATKCIKTLVTLGLDSLQQGWWEPSPKFCFCFLCKSQMLSHLLLLEETCSIALRGTVLIRKVMCELGKRCFPSVFYVTPMSLEQRGWRQDGPAQHPESPGPLPSVWGESLKDFLPKESSSAWQVSWSQTGSQVDA